MAVTSDTSSLIRRAQSLLVGGGQGHKRGYDIPGYPAFAVKGKGCRFWDDQGREFIDYLCAFGPILLGYGHPAVDGAVKRRIDEGMIFNVPHPAEADLAEKLVQLIPCAEMVSYFTGGSGATTGAVRVARAYTGKEIILRCGYHGWHDWCAASDPGVPKCVGPLTIEFDYGNIDQLKELFRLHANNIACVIMEPLIQNDPPPGYLAAVKSLCEENDALFILDEVKTGFRYSTGGAQEYFGITPHLSTFGKAMANGYDIGVLVGKKEILSQCEDVWLAATFHAHLLGIEAAMATIEEVEKTNVISFIWKQGRKLMDGLDEIARRYGVDAKCHGHPPMPILRFTEESEQESRRFWQSAVKRGVFFSPGHVWFISASHDDEAIEKTLQVSEEAMAEAVR